MSEHDAQVGRPPDRQRQDRARGAASRASSWSISCARILALTGTHVGCEHGVCGACTILFNGEAARSCIMFAVQADGAEIVTVEGLAQGGALHPLQEAFHQHHGLQCGFCTPGMLMTALDFLRVNPSPSEPRSAGAVRRPLPLHRLPEHRQGGHGGRRDDAARAGLEQDRRR